MTNRPCSESCWIYRKRTNRGPLKSSTLNPVHAHRSVTLDPVWDRPQRVESRNRSPDLREVHLVVTRIRSGTLGKIDFGAGDFTHLLCNDANLRDVFFTANVGALVVYQVAGRLKKSANAPEMSSTCTSGRHGLRSHCSRALRW